MKLLRSLWPIVALALLVVPVYGDHGSWMDKYKSASNMLCCGERDCRPVYARMLKQTAEQATVEVNGTVVRLPKLSVHTSEDTNDWACVISQEYPLREGNIRCLFIASGT